MIGFEVSVNGRRVCTAGAGEGLLTAIVSSVASRSELKLEVGGLLEDAHLAWATPPSLGVGDEVTVRVVETDKPDAPTTTKRDDTSVVKEGERRYYERLKRKYEGT
jgi:hypothetical protein